MVLAIPATAFEIDPVWLVWTICVGVCLSLVYVFVSKILTGAVIRKLLDKGVGEENAKTLYELELSSFYIKLYSFTLRDGKHLRSLVSCVGGTIPKSVEKLEPSNDTDKPIEPQEYLDFTKAKFYISKEKEEKARSMYGKAPKWFWLPISLAIAIVVAYLCTLALPWVLGLIG